MYSNSNNITDTEENYRWAIGGFVDVGDSAGPFAVDFDYRVARVYRTVGFRCVIQPT